jgi:hypothetical protein
MQRNDLGLALVLVATIGVGACSRGNGDVERADNRGSAVETDGQTTVTGCLTGAPDGNAFVVTASRDALASTTLNRTTGEVPTYTYELRGGTDLAAHVGREVEVKGRLDKDRSDEVDVDNRGASQPAAAQAGQEAKGEVKTREEIEIKVRRLDVTSVRPTGAACKSASGQ